RQHAERPACVARCLRCQHRMLCKRSYLVLILMTACGSSHRDPAPAAVGAKAEPKVELSAGARAEAEPTPAPRSAPHQTKIIVENTGPEAVALEYSCGARWPQLARDGQKLEIDPYCKTSCDTPNLAGCPAICLPYDSLLVPGERRKFDWDGVFLE